jgi:copper transport protein
MKKYLDLITESIFCKLIFAKICIVIIMIRLECWFPVKIKKSPERNLPGSLISTQKKLKRSLKFDTILGVALLVVVIPFAIDTLLVGEIQKVVAQETLRSFKTIEFSDQIKYDVEIAPFSSGLNTITVKISDFENKPLTDLDKITMKISNLQKNIAPIEIPMKEFNKQGDMPVEFQGLFTFGFSGQWQIKIEVQRTQNGNESILMNLLVKPKLEDLKIQIVEYPFPESSKPLYPLYDGNNSIWISDPSSPRLWKFSLESHEFSSYSFDGLATMFLTHDNKGKIWFTDTPRTQIGYFDPKNNQITTKTLPKLDPVIYDNVPTFIQADFDGNIWVAITNKNLILKYHPEDDSFEQIKMPSRETGPFALTIDQQGKIWFTESNSGKIGFINPKNNEINEFSPEKPLASPETLTFDKDGNLWIAEHTGLAITKFNPILKTFERISVQDKDALPYGISFDQFENIWIAQHTVNNLSVYDSSNNDLIEVPIPTETSFVQFLTSDNKENVWLVEQQGNKLGRIQITEVPNIESQTPTGNGFQLKYTEIASLLIVLGIIAISLFFVRRLKNKSRLRLLIIS